MGLFDFVEENQSIRKLRSTEALEVVAGEDGLCIGVADIAGRRTHEAGGFVLLLVFGAIDLEQSAGAAQQHFGQRLYRMGFSAAGGSEQEHGAHGPARLPGLDFNALKEAKDGVGGLGLADNPGAPTPRNVFEPGTARGGPQGDPSFGFVLDANAGCIRAPPPRPFGFDPRFKTTDGFCSLPFIGGSGVEH